MTNVSASSPEPTQAARTEQTSIAEVDDQENADEESARREQSVKRLQWEKEVERDLLLALQSWRALARALANLGPSNGESYSHADVVGMVQAQAIAFRKPVYFPLGGKSEAALGDALFKFDKLVLVECKRHINGASWDEEVNPRAPSTKDRAGQPKGAVDYGKDRVHQLEKVENNWAGRAARTPREISVACHVLVGRIGKKDAATGKLRFTEYWDFVMGAREDVGLIRGSPIDELVHKGSDYDDFRTYVLALMEARHASGEDKERVESRIFVLARTEGEWRGAPLGDQLIAELQSDARAALEQQHARGATAPVEGNAAPKITKENPPSGAVKPKI